MICVQTQSDIDFCRLVIDHEVHLIDERLVRLDNRLDSSSPHFERIQRLKNRQKFQLEAKKLKSLTRGTPVRPSAKNRSMDRKQPADRIAEIDDLESWLFSRGWPSARKEPAGTLWLMGVARSHTILTTLKKAGLKVDIVDPGEGQITLSPAGLSDRYRPSDRALASRLDKVSIEARKALAGFMLGSEAGCLDVELLRHRLWPHQLIMVEGSSPAAARLQEDWDGQCHRHDDWLIFSDPGASFLDPTGFDPGAKTEDWPKISVVTVSYNQASFLEACLQSVIGQDYPNLEYIVVDALSTDGSIDIIRAHEADISTLIIEADNGQSDGLNKGFSHATGDILTWINSDDMLAPGALYRVARTFQHYGCDMVAGGCERIDDQDEILFSHHGALPYGRALPLGHAANYMWGTSWEKGDYFFQPEVFFSSDIWRLSGGYLKTHLYWAMDWELWIRMAMAGAKIVHIPDVLGRSRQHADQKTTGDELYLFQLKNILLEHDDALAAMDDQIKELPVGQPIIWQPSATALAGQQGAASLFSRLWRLRAPRRLWAAMSKRLPSVITSRRFSFRRWRPSGRAE